MNVIDIEVLLDCVELRDDQLFWKERPRKYFSSQKECSRWNTRYAGTKAFNTLNRYGYLTGRLLGVSLYSHRVVWVIINKKFPDFWLDHIDGNKQNNCIQNLREVLYKENNKNSSLRSDNKTGKVGVSLRNKKYEANIKDLAGKQVFLGRFKDFKEAVAAREAAEKLFNYHENHGRVYDKN